MTAVLDHAPATTPMPLPAPVLPSPVAEAQPVITKVKCHNCTDGYFIPNMGGFDRGAFFGPKTQCQICQGTGLLDHIEPVTPPPPLSPAERYPSVVDQTDHSKIAIPSELPDLPFSATIKWEGPYNDIPRAKRVYADRAHPRSQAFDNATADDLTFIRRDIIHEGMIASRDKEIEGLKAEIARLGVEQPATNEEERLRAEVARLSEENAKLRHDYEALLRMGDEGPAMAQPTEAASTVQ